MKSPTYALALGLLAAIGCESTTAPLTGDIYVLLSIAGDPLPAPYARNQVSDHRIIADTLALAADGRGVRRSRLDDDAVDGGSHSREEELYWRQDGDRISMTFLCDDTADCIASPHLAGTQTETTLTIDYSVVSAQPLVYTRLGNR